MVNSNCLLDIIQSHLEREAQWALSALAWPAEMSVGDYLNHCGKTLIPFCLPPSESFPPSVHSHRTWRRAGTHRPFEMWRKCGRQSRNMRPSGRRLRSCSGSSGRRELGKRCSATLRMLGLSSKHGAGCSMHAWCRSCRVVKWFCMWVLEPNQLDSKIGFVWLKLCAWEVWEPWISQYSSM